MLPGVTPGVAQGVLLSQRISPSLITAPFTQWEPDPKDEIKI